MKSKIIIVQIIFVFVLSLLANYMPIASAKSSRDFSQGVSEIVMETNSKRILYQKNIHEKKYMASTTKILTAICVIENIDVDKEITITSKTIGVEGSSIYLEEGEKLTIKHLLYGLMLRSGNDCAETLAVACSGSIKEFASLMNNTAKKIGANNSNFVNPHGLHDENHYTTAYDLALISCYAMKNKTFKEIVSTKKIEIPFTTRNYNRVLINKNKMLKEFEGSTGIKTGYTKKAGRCLVSSCVKDGLELVSVVLNCPPMFERSKELLNDCYNKYKNYKILDCNNIIDFVDSDKGSIPVYIKKDVILPLTDSEYENLTIKYNYPNKITCFDNQVIGNIEIYASSNLIFTEKLFIMN